MIKRFANIHARNLIGCELVMLWIATNNIKCVVCSFHLFLYQAKGKSVGLTNDICTFVMKLIVVIIVRVIVMMMVQSMVVVQRSRSNYILRSFDQRNQNEFVLELANI